MTFAYHRVNFPVANFFLNRRIRIISVTSAELKGSLSEYFDGFFVFNSKDQYILQIPFDTFYTYFIDAKEFDTVHFCEFEPDEE
jgi:hypothetical protein